MTVDSRFLIVTCVFILLDVLLGVAGAVKNNNLQSAKLREGLWHKVGFFGLILFAGLFEYCSTLVDLGVDVPAVATVCIYVVVTEAVSIIENLCILNPEIAKSPLGTAFQNSTKIKQLLGNETTEEDSETKSEVE